jgi:hypothetical protein
MKSVSPIIRDGLHHVGIRNGIDPIGMFKIIRLIDGNWFAGGSRFEQVHECQL